MAMHTTSYIPFAIPQSFSNKIKASLALLVLVIIDGISEQDGDGGIGSVLHLGHS